MFDQLFSTVAVAVLIVFCYSMYITLISMPPFKTWPLVHEILCNSSGAKYYSFIMIFNYIHIAKSTTQNLATTRLRFQPGVGKVVIDPLQQNQGYLHFGFIAIFMLKWIFQIRNKCRNEFLKVKLPETNRYRWVRINITYAKQFVHLLGVRPRKAIFYLVKKLC
jgi:hypothetical protein